MAAQNEQPYEWTLFTVMGSPLIPLGYGVKPETITPSSPMRRTDKLKRPVA